jgi:hypothetical protein
MISFFVEKCWALSWGGENCLFSERFFKPIFVPLQVECNFRFLILDFRFKEFCPLYLIERSDSINPKSLRGVGPYDPYGPEAAI